MKTVNNFCFLIALLSVLTFACDSETEGSSETSTTASTASDATVEKTPDATPAPSNEIQLAVCLWPQAGLRDKPGSKKGLKWLAGVSFGEVVSLTGNTEEVDGKSYVEMELGDGKVGWSYDYLYALNAQRAVATGTVDIYKRPELTTFDGKQFETGEIFGVVEGDNEDWLEVYGKEKKKKGWIQKNTKFSSDELDVTVAIMISRAEMEKSPIKQEEKLKDIAKNTQFSQSPLMSVVDEKLIEISKLTQLPANQLMVISDNLNVRSAPDSELDNIVFKLQAGDVCNVLERGERVEIRKMNDYWYLIEKDGEEGWIYGYFTSKKLEE